MTEMGQKTEKKIFYGWYIVLFGALIIAVGSGILYHGFTVFFSSFKKGFRSK